MTTERHRFRTNAPNVSVPAGFRDLYCDSDGNLIRESPDGSKVPLDKLTSATPSDGTANISLESVLFNTANGASATIGGLAWDSTNDTLSLTMQHGVVLQIGQETLYHVENNTGSMIPNGTPVEYAGTVGNSGKLRVREWSGAVPAAFMGFATSDIENGGDGYVAHFGKVRGVRTDGGNYGEVWADGDIIYGDQDGGLTNAIPEGPNYVAAAVVISAHGSNGTLFVRPRIVVAQPTASTLSEATATLEAKPQALLVDDDTAGETVTITLPSAPAAANIQFDIKKVGSTADVVIVGTIDGQSSLTLRYQNSSVSLFSNGVAYFIK